MNGARSAAASRNPGPGSPGSRGATFGGFMPQSVFGAQGDTAPAAVRKLSVSPQMDRKSFDRFGAAIAEIDALVDGMDQRTPPASALVLRMLSSSMSQEALNTMLLFASDLIDARLVAYSQHDEPGFQTAIARFSTLDGALEVRNKLHGKPNASGDATMQVEVIKGSTGQDRRTSDMQVRHLSTSGSSTTSSNGQTKSSRFSNTFQSMDRTSPTRTRGSQVDLTMTQLSPTISHLDGQRSTGKAMINEDGDDETRELLQNPLAFAENGQRVRAIQPPLSQLANLRLDTDGSSVSPPNGAHRMAPPIQSPGSEYSYNYMSPVSPGGSYVSSPQYGRNHFPPANPADQNPPCNTLYVGNLPMDTAEEELKELFSKQRGYKRLCFRTKHNGPMCFVEFEDVSFATKTLHELYGAMLSNSVRSGIRLSFSKNPLGVRTGQSNLASPLASPLSPGYGSVGNPGFASASGPPPGLSMPPGLNGQDVGGFYPVNNTQSNFAPTFQGQGLPNYGRNGFTPMSNVLADVSMRR